VLKTKRKQESDIWKFFLYLSLFFTVHIVDGILSEAVPGNAGMGAPLSWLFC
jgi:hypothetical protein